MATPWIHPETGVYHIRRQIPRALRSAFGGRALYKRTLGTKDVARAAILFTEANAELERRFEEARRRLTNTGSAAPSGRDQADELVLAYFHGPEFMDGGLDGAERLELARVEIDRGLWNATEGGLSYPQPVDEQQWWTLSNNAALFRGWAGRRPVREHPPGTIWRWEDGTFAQDARAQQIARVVAQIARFHGIDDASLPAELPGAIASFLDDVPVAAPRQRRERASGTRLRPDLRITELFDAWQAKLGPTGQTAHEYESSMRDFVEMHGDVPVAEINADDLLDYRDAAAELPRSMPRLDRTLPFLRRVERHCGSDGQRISAATLKKRVGAIQALLTFAFNQKWIASNVGVGIPIEGYTRGAALKRNNFEEGELATLFSSPLFLSPAMWRTDRKVHDATLYWLFLFALTTGARIEEIGQALLDDVKESNGLVYIDIDDYVDGEVDSSKSLKTPNSRRLIPLHDQLRAAGFERYVAGLRRRGEVQLFPDLVAGRFGKRSKEASRIANRLIDRLVSKDRRLVFHSFRHQFKDFALEAGINERVADQITGHAPTTVGGRYGSGARLPALASFLHRIDWSFIDWPAIAAASSAAPWNAELDREQD